MVVSLFIQMTLPHLGILDVQCGSSRIKPSRFLRLVSLYSSLHQPKLYGMNGITSMPMSLISPKSLRYMSNCSRRNSQGVTFKTIMPAFVDFSLSWSCISHIRLILWLNTVIERSLLLLYFLEALTPQSPLRFKDLYWVRLVFWLSPRPSLLICKYQAGLLFYHHLHIPPCIIWLYNIAIFQFQGKWCRTGW